MRDYDIIAAVLRQEGELPRESVLPDGGVADTLDAIPPGFVEFAARITAAADTAWGPSTVQGSDKTPPYRARNGSRLEHWRITPLIRAVAAALILLAGGFWLGTFRAGYKGYATNTQQRVGTDIGSTVGTTAVTTIANVQPFEPPARDEVMGRVQTFDEINQFFDGRTRWLLLSRGDTELGLDESTSPATRPALGSGRVALLRLKLLRGNDVVSDTDLLIVPGANAELVVSTSGGALLRYRVVTSASKPGLVELRAELRPATAVEPQAALATHLQLIPDRATSAGQLVTPTGAYNLAVSYAIPI